MTTAPTTHGALARIRVLMPSLRAADAKVARAVLDDPERVLHLTVSDLATAAGTSAATVVRCCQQLGFRGFHDLKLALAQETRPGDDGPLAEVAAGDAPAVILEKVLGLGAAAIQDSLATIDRTQFTEATALLADAGHVLVVGVGTSAPLAQDAAYRLMLLGLRTQAPADTHVQHVAAGALRPGSVLLAVSHTGQTKETVACVAAARAAGATTIGVTSFARSPLTDALDVSLVATSRETAVRIEAMASRIAHLSVLDALCVALADRLAPASTQAAADAHRIISEHRW